jgi:hypothetical protein
MADASKTTLDHTMRDKTYLFMVHLILKIVLEKFIPQGLGDNPIVSARR